MAWNDPGKNENPWQRKPDQGPPDLDEVLRRIQRKLRALLGGGPRPVGNGSSGGRNALGIGTILIGIIAAWLAIGSWYLNEPAERSVITRFGKYVKTTGAGFNLRMPWPIDKREVINVTEVLTYPAQTRMLTQDEALVDINLAVQYRRADPVKFAFNVRDPEETLGEVSGSAIREIIGQSRLIAVLGVGRQEISVRTKDLVQRTIAAYNTGIEVMSVNLQDVNVPEQVSPAQKDAIKAREDKDRATLAALKLLLHLLLLLRLDPGVKVIGGKAVRLQKGRHLFRSRASGAVDDGPGGIALGQGNRAGSRAEP
jgi:membrane protease subunit HflK